MAGLQPLVLEFNWMKESVIEIDRLQKEYDTSKAQLASLEEKNSSGVLVSYWHEHGKRSRHLEAGLLEEYIERRCCVETVREPYETI